MANTVRQRKWRQRTAPASITAHLTRLETASLDAVALELYHAHPHDPRAGEWGGNVFPGRPEAIRELCRRYARAHPDKPWRRLSRLRNAFALFYRLEASWRRTTERSEMDKPAPPRV